MEPPNWFNNNGQILQLAVSFVAMLLSAFKVWQAWPEISKGEPGIRLRAYFSITALLFYTLIVVVVLAFLAKQRDSKLIDQLSTGSATIEADHPLDGSELAPGEVNQLILRRGSHIEESVVPRGFRFCSLQPGQYDVDVYVDNVLAVSDRFNVEKWRTAPVRVKVPDRGTVLVKVLGFDRKPVNGAVVQVVSLRKPEVLLRHEDIVDHYTVANDRRPKDAGTTGLLYLQPTVISSDGFKISVLWKTQEVDFRDLLKFQPGMNPPVEFHIDRARLQ
jgi:hypothetical protein